MSVEDDLLRLARERDSQMEMALGAMCLEPPADLGRALRNYLSRQVDQRRMARTDERIPGVRTLSGGVQELDCNNANFSSGTKLSFKIQLAQEQRGWFVRRFQFHLRLEPGRRIGMLRIHLNVEGSYDPFGVPRCHLHVGDCAAHIPFPIMHPRLILALLCEHIEPDFAMASPDAPAASRRRRKRK